MIHYHQPIHEAELVERFERITAAVQARELETGEPAIPQHVRTIFGAVLLLVLPENGVTRRTACISILGALAAYDELPAETREAIQKGAPPQHVAWREKIPDILPDLGDL